VKELLPLHNYRLRRKLNASSSACRTCGHRTQIVANKGHRLGDYFAGVGRGGRGDTESLFGPSAGG
jgi:hypothetical protein